MQTGKPSKPAGCFIQVIGGIILMLSFGIMGTGTVYSGIAIGAIGLAIMYWGGKT